MLTDEYIKRVYDQVVARDGDQPEFLQAVREVFGAQVTGFAVSARSRSAESSWSRCLPAPCGG